MARPKGKTRCETSLVYDANGATKNNTAYGRLCEARDVSHFVAYLLSEPVKLFTGSVLVMDGGISSQGW